MWKRQQQRVTMEPLSNPFMPLWKRKDCFPMSILSTPGMWVQRFWLTLSAIKALPFLDLCQKKAVGRLVQNRLLIWPSSTSIGKSSKLPVPKGRAVVTGLRRIIGMAKMLFMRSSVPPIAEAVPAMPFALEPKREYVCSVFIPIRFTIRLFSRHVSGRKRPTSKRSMPNVLGLKEPSLKGCEDLTYAMPGIKGLRKPGYSTNSSELPSIWYAWEPGSWKHL